MLYPLKSVTKRLARLRRFPALARRLGAVFLLDPRNWIDNRLLAGIPFEDAQIDAARRLIREHEIDIFIDVGANMGLYSILIGTMPEIVRVIAFEPVRRNFNQLLGNVFANRLDGKVEAHRVAAGASHESATIHIDPRSTGVSRFDPASAARDPRVFRDTERVIVAPLDDLVDLRGARIFLKIDVEGHAVPALSGMARLLAENHVVIQAELLDEDRQAIIAALAEQGYGLAREIAGDGIFLRGK